MTRGIGISYSIFLFMSWITTAIGLTTTVPWPLAVVFSLGISSAMGVLAPRLVPRWGEGLVWLGALVGYGVAAFCSVLFATAFYFQWFSGQDLETERVLEAQGTLVEQLARQKEYFGELAIRMRRLADYSRQQAGLEDSRGGTCAGSEGRGRGPFWAKRMWQADHFTRVAATFEDLSKRLEREVNGVMALVKDPALDGREKQIALKQRVPLVSAYAERRDLRRTLDDLDAQAAYETEGFPRDPRYCFQGQCFGGKPACNDGNLVARIRDVRALGDPQPIRLDLRIYDATDLRQNIQVVLDIWDELLGGGESGVRLDSKRRFSLAMGLFQDVMVLVIGFIIGRQRLARPALRISRERFRMLAERFEDILDHYPRVFAARAARPEPAVSDEERLHRIQLVLDEVTRPAGTDKVILLPMGGRAALRSRQRSVVDIESEQRLDAVIEVLNALSAARLVGVPLESLRNRFHRFRGYDTHAVAHWYGLASDSVAWFSVFLVSPVLMTESTGLLVRDEGDWPLHLRLALGLLKLVRPSRFRHEEAFRGGDAACLDKGLIAESLLARVVAPGSEPDKEGLSAEVIVYPELSIQDQVLERVLLDDDYGLHQDLKELEDRRAWFWRVFFPHRRYRLGPRSYRSLQAMLDTDGIPDEEAPDAGEKPNDEENGKDKEEGK